MKLKIILEKNKFIKKIIKFIYVRTYGKYKKNKENKLFLKNGRSALLQVDKVFKEMGKEYWLDFGTLLGAYRNKNFIKHDFDIDIAMFLEDYNEFNEEIFNKYGFKKIKSFLIDNGEYGREETYEHSGVSIDIFYYTKLDNNRAYMQYFQPLEGMSRDKTITVLGGLVPLEITLPIEKVGKLEFLGEFFPVPLPTEKHLAERYGEDFMIENPKWSHKNDVKNKNIKILKDKVGIRTLYK